MPWQFKGSLRRFLWQILNRYRFCSVLGILCFCYFIIYEFLFWYFCKCDYILQAFVNLITTTEALLLYHYREICQERSTLRLKATQITYKFLEYFTFKIFLKKNQQRKMFPPKRTEISGISPNLWKNSEYLKSICHNFAALKQKRKKSQFSI